MVMAVSTSSQTSARVNATPFLSAAKVTGERKVSTNRVGVRGFSMSADYLLACEDYHYRSSGWWTLPADPVREIL
jgi:hypothetical protein